MEEQQVLYHKTFEKTEDGISCKRLQHSIAGCVRCVHARNEKVLGEQKGKRHEKAELFCGGHLRVGLRQDWDTVRTKANRSDGGDGRRCGPLPQPLSSLVPRGEGGRRRCSLLLGRAEDYCWEGRGRGVEPRAAEGERVQR